MTKYEFIEILSEQAQACRHRNDIDTAKVIEFIIGIAYDLDNPEPTTRMATLSIPHDNS